MNFFRTLISSARAWLAIAAHRLHALVAPLRDKLRGSALLVVGIVTLWLVATPNPLVGNGNAVKVGMLAWLVSKLSVVAYLGYWIDRLLHPHSRPGDLKDIERMAAEKRRAFIVLGCLIAGGLFG